MSKKSRQFIEDVKENVRLILKDEPNASLVFIDKKLLVTGKHVADKTLAKIVSEIKNEKPETEQLPATSPADSTVYEYDDNPDIAKLNANLLVLENDFKNTKSGDERRKIMTAICLTHESKLRMQRTLKEKDAINIKKEENKIIIRFGDPSVIGPDIMKKSDE
jgi:hypothetical protein